MGLYIGGMQVLIMDYTCIYVHPHTPEQCSWVVAPGKRYILLVNYVNQKRKESLSLYRDCCLFLWVTPLEYLGGLKRLSRPPFGVSC